MKRALSIGLVTLLLAGCGGRASSILPTGGTTSSNHVRATRTINKTYDYTLSIAQLPSGFNPPCQETNITAWGVIGSPFNLASVEPTFTGGNPVDINVTACNAAAGDSMHALLEVQYGSMRFVPRTNGFAVDSVDASSATVTITDNTTGDSVNGLIYSTAPVNQRVDVWTMGSPWGLNGLGDGQSTDQAVFSGSQASCSNLQCTGGTGTASFHVQRPNTTTIPSVEYRNMMVMEKVTLPDTYAYDYSFVDGQAYDIRFQTVYKYQPDAPYVQSILWEVGGGENALGVNNDLGTGNRFFYNPNNASTGGFPWHSEVLTYGQVDIWEIQLLWTTNAATGWTDVYRNGTKVVHYTGAVKPQNPTNSYTAFGIYYYDWEIQRSTVLYQDMTFNYFELSTIPGPVAPL
jgi:hypothetical protein